MEEILYELREHSAGLNAGRWDYIFSVIKKFRNRRDFVLPDDVKAMAPAVLAHRLILGPEARAAGLSAADLIAEAIERTPVPV